MAEVVGIVAGAVQFIDVGSRVLISLSRFCSDLQHVPRKIKRVHRQLEQTLQLVESIKSDVEAPNTGPGTTLSGIISQPQVDFAKDLLGDAVAQVTELQVLLSKLAPTGDGFVKKAWRAVVAVKKEEEILSKCNDIETTISLLQTWMQHQSLKLIRDDILVDKDNARKISNVDQALGTVQQSLDDIPQAVENIVQTSQNAVLREIDTNTQYLGATTRRIEQSLDVVRHDVLQGVTTAETSMQGIMRSLKGEIVDELLLGRTSRSSETQALHSQLALMQQTMNRILTQHTSQRLISKPSYLEEVKYSARYTTPRPTTARNSLVPTRLGYGTLCICEAWRTRAHKNWRNFRFRYEPALVHDTNCPLHYRSKRTWTIGARAILPALWSYSIDVALQIDFGAGGFAISPSIRMATRIVDRQASPVFRALSSLDRSLSFIFCWWKSNAEPRISEIFERLRTILRQAFCDGRATAYDQDVRGTVVLESFLNAITAWLYIIPMDDLVITIIDLLFEFGAEGDLLRSHSSRAYTPFARVLGRHGCNIALDHVLIHNVSQIEAIWHNADLCVEFNLPSRYTAAVQKSLPGLEKSIESQTCEKRHMYLPSVLTFALHWPEGRKLLLAAGANPLDSIPFALQLHDMGALKDLIHEDLQFFYPVRSATEKSILNLWAAQRYTLSKSVRKTSLNLIINHLVQLRERLLDLARKYLPYREQKKLKIDSSGRQENFPDSTLLKAYQQLNCMAYNTPSFLYPGCQPSFYHLDFIDVCLAERLFRAGFHQIDSKDETGARPVELACEKGKLDLAVWLLQHGAAPNKDLIWSVAACRCLSINVPVWESLSTIILLCGYPENDTCQCYCSSKGCMPSTVLLKRKSMYTWKSQKVDFEKWTRSIPQQSPLDSYREACRLQIFERLGMSHTCCSFTWPYNEPYGVRARQEMQMDDQLEIREEERDFAIILNQYMDLFDQLLEKFTGPLTDFWNMWWSAVDMTLPATDMESLPTNGYWRRLCESRPDLKDIQAYGAHEKLTRLIIDQYSNVTSSLVRFVCPSDPWNVLRSWISYLSVFEISTDSSEYQIYWVLHLPEAFDMNCPTEDLPIFDSNFRLPELMFYDLPKRIELVNVYITDKLIPIIAPVIIAELYFGQSIPENLRKHLEAEGPLQGSVLVRSATNEDPETIFQDCMDALFGPSAF